MTTGAGVVTALVPRVAVSVEGLSATMLDGVQVVVPTPSALVVAVVGEVTLSGSVVNTKGRPAYPKLSPVETVVVATQVPDPAVKVPVKHGDEEAKVIAIAGAVPVP